MEDLFKEAPESITNTFAVAEMYEVKLPFGENSTPAFLNAARDQVGGRGQRRLPEASLCRWAQRPV